MKDSTLCQEGIFHEKDNFSSKTILACQLSDLLFEAPMRARARGLKTVQKRLQKHLTDILLTMKDSTLCQEGIFHEKEEKKTKKQSLSQIAEQTDGKQSSRSFLTRLRIRDSDLSSTSTEEELGQATSINWFSTLLLCNRIEMQTLLLLLHLTTKLIFKHE